MTSPVRLLLRRAAARWVNERVFPVGGVARDRRLLRRALTSVPVGRALVVGPNIAARQALRGAKVDVAGTVPQAPEVNVCSTVRTVGSLPPERWDTVVIADSGEQLEERLPAVLPACRPNAWLVVLRRDRRLAQADESALLRVASIQATLTSGRHRLWLARVHL